MNRSTLHFLPSRSKKSLLLSVCFILLSTIGFSQLTVTKTYSPGSSVTIDGCGSYCTILPGVSFSAADFSSGACQVTDVNVNIVWAKTDGSCTAPGTGNSFHNETNFRIDGPTGTNVILAQPGTWSGSVSTSSVSTTFNQGFGIPSGTPVSGTFGPNNGNLNSFNGTNPFGTWILRAGDTGGGDPLCIVAYSVTVTVSTGPDTDGDGTCNAIDTDDDNDGVADGSDPSSLNPNICGDSDGDGCDDCAIGTDDFGPLSDFAPANDGTDTDGDGICNSGDNDDDNDGVADGSDPNPLNPDICGDNDGDGCDDCAVGTDNFGPLADNNPANDGTDTDGDGICDFGDADDDNDGVADGSDVNPLNPFICGDADFDGCDDCSIGVDGFGPLADNNTANDGTDTDGDGICNLGDDDDDNDGVLDGADVDPLNPNLCEDADSDGCDDCALGTDGFGPLPDNDPLDDGPDSDGDGICDATDNDNDNDGVANGSDPSPLDPTICGDSDADGCDDCAIGTDGFGPMPDNTPANDGTDTDGDGICDTGDADDDNDGIADGFDPSPLDPTVCGDADADGCDDCSVGTDGFGSLSDSNPANDGIDTDGDGLCDTGDTDDDNDGILDGADLDPLNPFVCEDADGDGCDDCSIGVDGFGPLADNTPGNDDNTPPTPDLSVLPDVNAECEVTSLTTPTGTDNCGGTVTVTTTTGLPITAQGTTVVTWTYTDANGNTATQTQNVIINDVTAPVPDVATLTDVTAECEVTALIAPTATDNCGGVVTVTNDATLPITTQGTTVVTWTYLDENGNPSAQTQNVVITDVTPPVPDAATLTDATAECQINAGDIPQPTATDNCGGVVTVTSDAVYPITAQGTTTITWTYTDGAGNSSTQIQDVVITDVTPPVADAATLADVTDECEVTALTPPTATDNCGGVVIVTNDATLPITAQGTTTVTWTYDDGNGNTSTQTQNVVITDVTPPAPDMATLTDVMEECEVTALVPPTATDNCGGVVTVTNDAVLPITVQGTTTITWTYTDVNGNSSTQIQDVVIIDVTPPTPDVATLTDVTDECEVTALTAPTATDNCGGVVTVTNDATLPITAQGTTVVTWTYDDGNGNSSTQTQNVVITDVTPPVADAATLADITDECEVTALTPPTATDNCGGTVTVTNDATLPITIQGTTTVTWTYTDAAGNSSTQIQDVVITDVTPPVADVVVLSDVTAECEVTALMPPTATDNCGGVVTVTNDATLPITAQGTTTVTWTYDDGNGNTSTQIQDVVITDVTAPTPDVATLADVTDECSVIALIAPTATDNCGGVVTVTNDATLPITTQGTTVVTWTYDDGNGNTSTQTQNVVITDVTPPTPDMATLTDVMEECEVTALVPPTATDNCGGVVTVTNDAVLPITVQGTTTITWTYTDVNGNSSTQIQDVVIIDVTPPVADAAILLDVTDECEVTALTAPTATDNCGGVVTVTNDATLPITAQGTTVVTWTYDDGNGNSSTQTQNVVITDVTAPVADAATLADVTAECEVTALTAPTATDNCGGVVTVTNDATLPITAQGTTTVTWTYTDENGNSSTQTQDVVITDVTPPVADAATLADVTDECSVAALTNPTATDNCGGVVTVTSDAVLPITAQGTTTVTWTYTDASGNSSTQIQDVVITDVTPPTPDMATLTDVMEECEVTALVPPTATDNCGGVVTVTNDATLPITAQGTTTVTWTYDDGNGNTSTQIQDVVIIDVTPPVADAAILLDVTAECEVTALTAPTATDNCGGVVTVTNDATLPITAQGTTVVTWTYDDGNGNSSTQTQDVVITDITAPVADAATLSDVTAECEVTALTAPTATDNCGGVVTVTNDATLPITAQGTTTVTWTYTDENGNSSTQTQDVVITDVTPPVADAATLADVTDECSVAALTNPTATDNCGGVVTVTSDAVLPITAQGTTTVTWTYTDASGNSSTQTQNVVITDVTAPTPDMATLTDVMEECEVIALVPPTATDNCGGVVTVTNDATLPITAQGTTTVTWTYDDGNGNTSTQIQDVVIIDVTPPTPDVATLADVTAECSVTALTAPTATDNCGGAINVTHDATLPITTQGTTTVTWTYDDGNGNSSTQTQDVVITDVTAPVADIATLADVTDECSVAALTNPTATDNCGGVVTVTSDAVLPISTQGTTVVTWTYTDENGNTSTQTQNVVITDVTAPTPDMATLTDVMAECEVLALTPPTATDNCGGVVTVTNDATLPITVQGTTTVTWTYTDENGNTSTQIQDVVIIDVTPPTADVAVLTDVTAECEVTTLTAPTATDNCGGAINVTHDATLPITAQGTTVVTWTYDDGNGNSSTQTQNVVITDVTGPVADAALPDLTDICSVDMPTAPTATDNCAGSITGTTTTTFPVTTIGTTVVTWSYADGNGNVTTQTQDIIISGVDVSTSLSTDGLTITALNALGTYQWIDCSDNSLVVGETNSTFSPTANGDYAVIVTEGGCVDTSACVTVSTVGIGTISIARITVYPNPSLDGYFTVSYDGTIEEIQVLDMLGRSIPLSVDLNSGVVDGSELADGRYIVRVKTDVGYAMSEIVIAN